MKTLLYLYALQIRSKVRNIFRKPSTAIFAIVLILFYGFVFYRLFTSGTTSLSSDHALQANIAIFISMGITALIVCTSLLQKRSAIFSETNAFYIFTGPFQRKEAMYFIVSRSIVGSIFGGLASILFMVGYAYQMTYGVLFLFLTFLANYLTCFFFSVLSNYLYLINIREKSKYRYIGTILLVCLIVFLFATFLVVLAQYHFSMQGIFMHYLKADVFYAVPFFGWIKLLLVSYIQHNYWLSALGLGLLLVSSMLLSKLLICFKEDFVEKVMQDATEYTLRYNAVKAGRRNSFRDKKVHNVKYVNFKEGAGAILSKNILLMKKEHSFIGKQDIILMLVYSLIAFAVSRDMNFFVYMMVIWLYICLQHAGFEDEMYHYQIYLIPAKSFAKLWYLIAPYIIKYMILCLLVILVDAVVTQTSPIYGIQYYGVLISFVFLFISASVLAIRLLKSRNNVFMGNMLRMLVIFLSTLPSIIILVVINTVLPDMGLFSITIICMTILLLNFVIAMLILYSCSGMMNGCDIQSE